MDAILQELRLEARGISNTTKYFLTLAENYINAGDIAHAKACLILLCEYCSNYEESIEFNDLTDKWEAYRYLVEGLVPPSVPFNSIAPCSPDQCTMKITEILALADDDLLSALSDHLGELSGQGNSLERLNKWERIVFFVDELWSEVNSGGFSSYLYYFGTHFEKACRALKAIGAEAVAHMLSDIEQTFPRGRVPKTEEAIQNAIDQMEESGIDFEEVDDCFYSVGEMELCSCLLAYVRENQRHFR